MKVLIADDDTISRTLLCRLVARWGYEVVVAVDGEEAVRLLREDRTIQLCIIDWVMPKMTGPEVCAEVRAWGDEPYVYTILLTSRTETSDVVAGLSSGADDYVIKPCHPPELEFRLRSGVRVIELQRHLTDAREQLRVEATHDSLTGVLNRRAIFDQLAKELSRGGRHAQPITAVLLDVDHFKMVNDTHGHQAGDAVLREIPKRIRSVLRDYDSIGRYGGEEFLTILGGCDSPGAFVVAERIRSAIAVTPFSIPGGKITVTASLGVATNLDPRALVEDLVRAADHALYRSKHSGRNQVQIAIEEEFLAPVSSKTAGSAA